MSYLPDTLLTNNRRSFCHSAFLTSQTPPSHHASNHSDPNITPHLPPLRLYHHIIPLSNQTPPPQSNSHHSDRPYPTPVKAPAGPVRTPAAPACIVHAPSRQPCATRSPTCTRDGSDPLRAHSSWDQFEATHLPLALNMRSAMADVSDASWRDLCAWWQWASHLV